MRALKVCLEKCQEEDIVQNFNLQVTGGVNFSFTALKGQVLYFILFQNVSPPCSFVLSTLGTHIMLRGIVCAHEHCICDT